VIQQKNSKQLNILWQSPSFIFTFQNPVFKIFFMERRKFFSTLGSPVLAACAVCMASCSKSSDSQATTPPPAGSINLSIDLNSQLAAIGSSIVQNGVIITRLASVNTAASFTALQVACTHEGTAIQFEAGNNDFICPNHGSRFTTNGTVINGPATKDLKKYTIQISGNTMTITG
jgi:Rieske Fe-S protein